MAYHNFEELAIAAVCLVLGIRTSRLSRAGAGEDAAETDARIFLTASGFFMLSASSAVHSLIHIVGVDENLLFYTLLGYTVGLLILIFSLSAHTLPSRKVFVSLISLPFLLMFVPRFYEGHPAFGIFRPILWIIVAYCAGALCVLQVAIFQERRTKSHLYAALAFALISVSGVFLFFPGAIGSPPWVWGHLLRPVGFLLLFFAVTRDSLLDLRASILYRALTVFTLLAGFPVIVFGMTILYQEIQPSDLLGRRVMIFLLLLLTLVAALVFSVVIIARLIRPVITLTKEVRSLASRETPRRISRQSGDELGDLAGSFNTMMSELEQSMEEKLRLGRLAATGELAATLAHEIRNPLNAINGAADYLSKNVKGSLITEFLGIIREEVSRINRLTTSLLNFAKPVVPHPSKTDINELIRETVRLVSPEYHDKGVSLVTSLDGSLPPVSVDPSQIKQVLINLLINGLAASAKGKSVTVATGREDGDFLISVVDAGDGISPNDLGNIFKPFFTTKTAGTGLGLAITEKIVREHGGDIAVASAEGQGSTFTIRLPRRNG